jgi:hypothetical protein
MKKQIIQISHSMDYVYLNVNGKINSRFPIKSSENKNAVRQVLTQVKVAAFDLTTHMQLTFGTENVQLIALIEEL